MRKFKNKLLCMFMILTMMISILSVNISSVFAEEIKANTVHVKVRVEADRTILPETTLDVDNFSMKDYGINNQIDNVNVMNALIRALEKNNVNCKDKNKFDVEMGQYGAFVKTIDGITEAGTGGWMYCINNTSPSNGMEQQEIKNGDSIVVYYVSDYSTVYSFFDKSEVSTTTGSIALKLQGNFYDENWNQYVKGIDEAKILVDGKEVNVDGNIVVTDKDGNFVLNFDKSGTYTVSAEKSGISRPYCKVVVDLDNDESADEQKVDYTNTINTLISSISSTIAINDWSAMELNKAGKEFSKDDYLASVEKTIKEKNGVLGSATDYEKITLGILGAGGNPKNFGGYDLVEKIYNNEKMNGINAYIFGLLALDAANFKVPKDAKWTREVLIQKILDCKIEDGGWALSGKAADPDITAITLSALAPYYNTNAEVKAAIDEAIEKLSSIQTDNGGYKSWGTYNSNSTAMVIIGLCDNGIDITTDKRFIKNGNSLLDALLSFVVSDNSGFGYTNNTKINALSTEQCFRALVAYNLFKDGKGSIYKGFNVDEPADNPADDPVVNNSMEITNLTNAEEFKLDSDAKVTIKAENRNNQSKTATLIVGLYDNEGKLVNYVASKQSIDAGKAVELTGTIKTPETGKYTIKAFVWDSLEDMNPLSNTIEVPVK